MGFKAGMGIPTGTKTPAGLGVFEILFFLSVRCSVRVGSDIAACTLVPSAVGKGLECSMIFQKSAV